MNNHSTTVDENAFVSFEGSVRTYAQVRDVLLSRQADAENRLQRSAAALREAQLLKAREAALGVGPLDIDDSDDDDCNRSHPPGVKRVRFATAEPADPLLEPHHPPSMRVPPPRGPSPGHPPPTAWIGRRTPGGLTLVDQRDALTDQDLNAGFVLRSPDGARDGSCVPRGRIRYASSPVCLRPASAAEKTPWRNAPPPPPSPTHATLDDEEYDFEPPLRRPPRSSNQRLNLTPSDVTPIAPAAEGLRDDDENSIARRTTQVLDELLSQMRLSTDIAPPTLLPCTADGASPPQIVWSTQRRWASSSPSRRPSVLLRDYAE